MTLSTVRVCVLYQSHSHNRHTRRHHSITDRVVPLSSWTCSARHWPLSSEDGTGNGGDDETACDQGIRRNRMVRAGTVFRFLSCPTSTVLDFTRRQCAPAKLVDMCAVTEVG